MVQIALRDKTNAMAITRTSENAQKAGENAQPSAHMLSANAPEKGQLFGTRYRWMIHVWGQLECQDLDSQLFQ